MAFDYGTSISYNNLLVVFTLETKQAKKYFKTSKF